MNPADSLKPGAHEPTVRSMGSTTGDVVACYMHERTATREFAATTARTVGYVLRGFAEACPDDINKIKPSHVIRWIERQSKCRTSTVASRYGTVRAFLRWANATGRMTKDPSLGIKGPERPRRQPRALDPEEVSLLLATAPDTRTRLAVALMACEGLRISEVCSLQVGDIDWRRENITVIGKGDKQRTVHLSPSTKIAAKAYLAEWPASSGPLIRSQHDGVTPVGPNRLGRVVTAHMADEGVKDAPRDGKSPHAFRHTYGSDLVDEGLTIPEVADLMGHASVETTMKYQRNVDLNRTRDVANRRSYARGV